MLGAYGIGVISMSMLDSHFDRDRHNGLLASSERQLTLQIAKTEATSNTVQHATVPASVQDGRKGRRQGRMHNEPRRAVSEPVNPLPLRIVGD